MDDYASGLSAEQMSVLETVLKGYVRCTVSG